MLVGGAVSVGTVLAGCISQSSSDEPAIIGESIILTTTTSTYDTGLLGELNEAFSARFGVTVDAVAQGTGAALRTARDGDADVVMVHARELEDEFLRDGYGVNRRDLMFNDFVILGPANDPASVTDAPSVEAAFAAIATTESTFVSRGDGSGTHQKERDLWAAAGIDPNGEWYRSVGAGMGEVLNHVSLADGAYTLADRGTFIAQRSTLEDVTVLVEGPIEGGPEILANPYGILAVNPAIHSHVAYDLAMAYIGFLTSAEGQDIIDSFTIDGDQVFFPRAVAADPNFAQYVPREWADA